MIQPKDRFKQVPSERPEGGVSVPDIPDIVVLPGNKGYKPGKPPVYFDVNIPVL